MGSPWRRRLWRDLTGTPGRTALLVVAVAAALAAVGTVLGGRALLVREIGRSYRSTSPASATLVLDRPVDEALLAAVRARPGVVDADAREVIVARVTGEASRPLLLFVVDAFSDLRLNTFTLQRGAWPGTDGIAIERSALPLLDADLGGTVVVKTPHGAAQPRTVTAVVHDPGLAPAPMERTVYGYVDRAGLAALGEEPALHELRVRFAVTDRAAIDAAAEQLAADLGGVEEIRVPPLDLHPHQLQMETVTGLMLGFAVLGLVLAGVVVASALAALLAREQREIGILKTLGARRARIVLGHGALAAGLGALALPLALPLAVIGAEVQAAQIAAVLNFDLADRTIPAWVFAVLIAAGIGVPALLALPPVLGAARVPVRAALDRHGAAEAPLRRWLVWLPRPARQAARRPRRLAVTLTLLATGGALFLAALDVRASWEANVAEMGTTRHYDAEIRFESPESLVVLDEIRALPGVTAVESWDRAVAAVARPGGVPLTRTWPDEGHGSFVALAPPLDSLLTTFPLIAGRRLAATDDDGVLLNHAALPGTAVGERVALIVDHQRVELRVVGIVREIGSGGVAYLTPATFARVTGRADATRQVRVVGEVGAVAAALEARGHPVALVVPSVELTGAVSEHIGILVQTLLAMAVLLGIVGGIGLGSAMATSVLERTRELAVLKTLGARPWRLTADLLAEAWTVAAGSALLATLASLPLAWAMDALIGSLGFLAPLPFAVDGVGIGAWLVLVLVVATVATLPPARAAGRLRVVDGLAVL